jgi:hypothetical protein
VTPRKGIPDRTAPRVTDPYHTAPAYSKSPSPTRPTVPEFAAHTAAAIVVPAPTAVAQPASSAVLRIPAVVASPAFVVVATPLDVEPRVDVAFLHIRVVLVPVRLTKSLRLVRDQ